MSNVFAQRRQKLLSLKALRGSSPAPAQTEETCPACSQAVPRRELVANRYVCPLCGHHYPVGAYYRLSLILDKGTFRELDANLASNDPLDFPDYEIKLASGWPWAPSTAASSWAACPPPWGRRSPGWWSSPTSTSCP